VIYLNG